MAAYAALVSLMQIIHQIKNHPSPPFSIHKKQLESLTQNATFLQEFLDCYDSPYTYSDKVDPLEIRIADAAYAAEDVIESRIVDRIHNRSTVLGKMVTSIGEFFEGLCKCFAIEDYDLHQVIEEMNLIKKEVTEITAENPAVQARVHVRREVFLTGQAGSSSTVKEESVVVGIDDVLLEVLDKLTGGQPNRQIIPITGMGGIGKTTLAQYLFENALTKEHFDIRVWTTISQVYDTRETLREVLFQSSGVSSELDESGLGERLHKYLAGKRYLIVLDDIWSVDAWDKMKFFFPDYYNGSRIIVTTRLSDMASRLSESYVVGMDLLNEASSWDLFCKIVFGDENVPLELEKIGKKIVADCKGLPLSITTIGGLLANSERTTSYWKHIEEILNSVVIKNNDDSCLKILKMSYVNLPIYLKPCFLYMGVFVEDWTIRVSTLKKLWASEGIVKPVKGKCLETVAEEYLKELVDRNLILIHQLGLNGNVKFCKIHDLLRDLSLRQAADERFHHVLGQPSPNHHQGANSKRRIVIPKGSADAFKSSSSARSIISDEKLVQISGNLRLLRTLKALDRDKDLFWNGSYSLAVLKLVNSRYLAVRTHDDSKLPSSINLIWNLQTLIMSPWGYVTAPVEIWEMNQLRHVEFMSKGLYLPDPPRDNGDVVIMGNLETLTGVKDFYLDDNVVKRIPNVRKLGVRYDAKSLTERVKSCLTYLQCLSKLENLRCSTGQGCDELLEKITFPHSLKKLRLEASMSNASFELEHMLHKIGWLPLLQKLIVEGGYFRRQEWETSEGQFRNLKLLELSYCHYFGKWRVWESSHFPLLQELRHSGLNELEEIPSEIGEIATLKSIVLTRCGESVLLSAKKIVEEQEELLGEQPDLHVRVKCMTKNDVKALQYLATPNFHVSVL